MPEATDAQQMEIDMVAGMYDTFELLTSDPPSYAVLLAASADDPPELKVTVTYPSEAYPECVACDVVIENISKKRRIHTAHICKEVAATCEESVGMHVVVLVLQQVQDFLVNSAQEAEKAELLRRGEALEKAAVSSGAVSHDPTIRIGTAVTKELFEEWSQKHLAAKNLLRAEREQNEAKVSASKLTGRQLWDSTLKSADWELFAEGGVDGEELDFEAVKDEFGDEGYDLDDTDD